MFQQVLYGRVQGRVRRALNYPKTPSIMYTHSTYFGVKVCNGTYFGLFGVLNIGL